MKRLSAVLCTLLLGSTVALSACKSGSDVSGEEILQKMHDKKVAKILELLNEVEFAERNKNDFDFTLNLDVKDPELPVKGTLTFQADQVTDMTDSEAPAFDLAMLLNADFTMPMAAIDPSLAGSDEEATFKANFDISMRMLEQYFYFVIDEANVSTTMFPMQIALAEPLIETWYGMTQTEINEFIRSDGDANLVDFNVADLFQNPKIGYDQLKTEAERVLHTTNIWLPMEVLTEKNDMYQVRVEADKAKLEASLIAMVDAFFTINTANYSSWMTPEDIVEIEQEVESMKAEIRTAIQEELDQITGVMTITKDYEFAGFRGDVVAKDSADSLLVDIVWLEDHTRIKLSSAEKPDTENLIFEHKDDNYTFTVEGDTIIKGIASDDTFTMDIFEGARPEPAVSLVMDIEEWTKTEFEASGKITFADVPLEIVIKEFEGTSSNKMKDWDVALAADIIYEGSVWGGFAYTGVQTEESSVDIAAPEAFEPVEKFVEAMSRFTEQTMGAFGPPEGVYDELPPEYYEDPANFEGLEDLQFDENGNLILPE